MTYKEMKDAVKIRLPSGIKELVPESELEDEINNVIEDFVLKTKSLSDFIRITSVKGQADYPLPLDFIDILEVRYDGIKLMDENVTDS